MYLFKTISVLILIAGIGLTIASFQVNAGTPTSSNASCAQQFASLLRRDSPAIAPDLYQRKLRGDQKAWDELSHLRRNTSASTGPLVYMEYNARGFITPVVFRTNFSGTVHELDFLAAGAQRFMGHDAIDFKAFQIEMTHKGYTCELVEQLNKDAAPPAGLLWLDGPRGW